MRRVRILTTLLCSSLCALTVMSSHTHAVSSGRQALTTSILRVCADPSNLPFSNNKLEGFENKIIEKIAEKLELEVRYTWFPQTIGFVRNTLRKQLADKKLGVVAGTPPANIVAQLGLLANVKPYQLVTDTRHHIPAKEAINDVANGTTDVAFLWGPLAAHHARDVDTKLTTMY